MSLLLRVYSKLGRYEEFVSVVKKYNGVVDKSETNPAETHKWWFYFNNGDDLANVIEYLEAKNFDYEYSQISASGASEI
jgi:hypothetical protein